jgi:hypothetical protein
MSALLLQLGGAARSVAQRTLVVGVVLGLAIGSLALAAAERARA